MHVLLQVLLVAGLSVGTFILIALAGYAALWIYTKRD